MSDEKENTSGAPEESIEAALEAGLTPAGAIAGMDVSDELKSELLRQAGEDIPVPVDDMGTPDPIGASDPSDPDWVDVPDDTSYTNTDGFTGLSKTIKSWDGKISKDPLAGLDNTQMEEVVPRYNKAQCERIYKGDNNTWIILGRDRDKGWTSGYGGKGHTRAGAIDIVVGLAGFAPNCCDGTDSDFNKKVTEKNFGSMGNGRPGDAARIYISQRADIDNYFDICDGSVGNSKGMSAIGIKADEVRIMARRGIKIVTGQAPQQRTSLNGKIPAQFGIDLIAGNRDSVGAPAGDQHPLVAMFRPNQSYIQPIPKGQNLVNCLEDLFDQVTRLNELLTDWMAKQMLININMAVATNVGSAGPVPCWSQSTAIPYVIKETTSAISLIWADLFAQQIELNGLKADYLLESGAIYINSRHNRTN